MYNRYIPQPDGSFRRSHHPDTQRSKPKEPTWQKQPPTQLPVQNSTQNPIKKTQTQHAKEENPLGFLRQLLPRDFDSGDLIIILLLLLIAGDKEDDRAHALLTIALYLVM